ncbi:HAD-IA family hydrolase [Shewanella sp. AS16]|nr:HAD-IA family hydrolase [Shewanella sp. AS16]
MSDALVESGYFNEIQVENCIDSFKKNFGRSRFYHVDKFVELLTMTASDKKEAVDSIISTYSDNVERLYMSTPLSSGLIAVLDRFKNKAMYVASGSEQTQLRRVFHTRNLSQYFRDVLGSPMGKAKNIENILYSERCSNAIMIGDAVADYEAAKHNNIDFMFYSPLSNVLEEMLSLSKKFNFPVIDEFKV